MNGTITRRMMLKQGMQCSLGAAAALGLSGCGSEDGGRVACVDPEDLSRGEISMRESLSYTDISPNPDKACSACAYFSADEPGANCGRCEILNGQVSDRARCDSWSQRS